MGRLVKRKLTCIFFMVGLFLWAGESSSRREYALPRIQGARLLVGWSEIDSLFVTNSSDTIRILPVPDQPETRSYPSPVYSSISHDGRTVGFVCLKSAAPQRAAVAVFSVADRTFREYAEGTYIQAVSVSLDGARLAFVMVQEKKSRVQLHVVELKSGSDRIVPLDGEAWGPLGWGRDNDHLVYESNQRIGVVELSTGKSQFIAGGSEPSWSPSGEWIAYLDQYGNRCNIVHPDGTDKQVLAILHRKKFEVRDGVFGLPPVWSPDSTKLLLNEEFASDWPRSALLLDLKTNKLKKLTEGVSVLGWAEAK